MTVLRSTPGVKISTLASSSRTILGILKNCPFFNSSHPEPRPTKQEIKGRTATIEPSNCKNETNQKAPNLLCQLLLSFNKSLTKPKLLHNMNRAYKIQIKLIQILFNNLAP